jgi:hypothetical protein
MTSEPRIAVEIWSDYVCPFCYLELPAVERLKEEFGPRVDVSWHAFELRPEPAPTLDPDGEYLHDIWGRSVYPMAEERGMRLRLPPVQPQGVRGGCPCKDSRPVRPHARRAFPWFLRTWKRYRKHRDPA